MADWVLSITDDIEFNLAGGCLTLGRDDACDVPLDESCTSVSRQHARLEMTSHGVVVTDLRSRNGTRVNGRPIAAPTLLQAGDVIEFGTVRAILRDRSQAPPQGGAPPAATQFMHDIDYAEVGTGTPGRKPDQRPPTSHGRGATPGQRAGEWVDAAIAGLLAPGWPARPSTPADRVTLQINAGAALLIIGVLGWLACSNELVPMQSGWGQVVRAFNPDARQQYFLLEGLWLLAAGVGIGGLILLVVGLLKRYGTMRS